MTGKESGPAGRKPAGRGPIAPTELAGFGVQFVVSVLLFLYAGRWLDTRLGTSPWLLLLGTFLGAGAAFYSLYRKLVGPSR